MDPRAPWPGWGRWSGSKAPCVAGAARRRIFAADETGRVEFRGALRFDVGHSWVSVSLRKRTNHCDRARLVASRVAREAFLSRASSCLDSG